MSQFRILRNVAAGCVEFGSVAMFLGALWVWAEALARV